MKNVLKYSFSKMTILSRLLNTVIKKITKNYTLESKIKLAIYCAELVLPIFEKEYPYDDRPKLAVEAAKKCMESNTEENNALADAALPSAAGAVLPADSAADYAASANILAAAAGAMSANDSDDSNAALIAATGANAAIIAAGAAATYEAVYTDIILKIIYYALKLSKEK